MPPAPDAASPGHGNGCGRGGDGRGRGYGSEAWEKRYIITLPESTRGDDRSCPLRMRPKAQALNPARPAARDSGFALCAPRNDDEQALAVPNVAPLERGNGPERPRIVSGSVTRLLNRFACVSLAGHSRCLWGRTINVAGRGPSEFQSKADGPTKSSRSDTSSRFERKADRDAVRNEYACPHGLPITIAIAAARNGNGSETAARNQTKRAGMNGISQRIMRWKANSAQATT